MFKIIDACHRVYDAYGTFIDDYGDVQFILVNRDGTFYKTDVIPGYFTLYKED